MDRNVCVLAGGMSKWGVREGSQRDFFQEAAKACYDDNPLMKPKDIDGLLVASAYTERTSCQTNLAPLVAEYVGVKPKNLCARVELLCASGSSAIILAFAMIKSGQADVVMVAGGRSSEPAALCMTSTALGAASSAGLAARGRRSCMPVGML